MNENHQDMEKLKALGFSKYEINCYLALAAHHPANGSQLSKISGIARSRIYDVLRKMIRKGFVMEVENGLYVPLPPEEFIKRLKTRFDDSLKALEQRLAEPTRHLAYEYIWSIRGYNTVIGKARQMIAAASSELYIRLFPQAGQLLEEDLKAAEKRGVAIRYIAMGKVPLNFEVQVIHPGTENLMKTIGGRSFDIIADKSEALVGIFEDGQEDTSPISWTRNRWFVIANRDSLRHDFYHYFLEKTYDRQKPLNEREKRIYNIIKADA